MKHFKKYLMPSLMATALFSTVALPTGAAAKEFKDVSKDANYYQTVQKLVEFNVISGYSDGTFKPNNLLTRGQAATMIARILEVEMNNLKDPGFKDVSKENSHYPAIAKLMEMGILDKSSNFYPNRQITRAEMAGILVEAFDLISDTVESYEDVKRNNKYSEAIGILGGLGITKTVGDFRPEDGVKRANFAVFIERIINIKRNDNMLDMWDSWGSWDGRGVISHDTGNEKSPVQGDNSIVNTPIDITKVNDVEKLIHKVTTDLSTERVNTKQDLDTLLATIRGGDKKEIEKSQLELTKSLDELNNAMNGAEEVFDITKSKNDVLQKLQDNLEKKLTDARKFVTDAENKSHDKKYYDREMDDSEDELKDLTTEINNLISAGSNRGILENKYGEMATVIEQANKVLTLYRASSVKSLEDEKEDLEVALDAANKVLKKLEQEVKRLGGDVSRFKTKSFLSQPVNINSLNDLEVTLNNAINEVTDAQDKADRILEDLVAALKEDDAAEVAEEQKKLDSALKELNQIIQKAQGIFIIAKMKNEVLQRLEDDLSKEMDWASKIASNAYEQSYNRYYFERELNSKQEELDTYIEDVDRLLKLSNPTLSAVDKTYDSIETAIKETNELLELYSDASINTLKDEKESLVKTLDQVEDALEDLAQRIKDDFDDLVGDQEASIDDLIKASKYLNDDGEIIQAIKNLNTAIDKAKRLKDDYKDIDVKVLDRNKKNLDEAIKRAEKEIKRLNDKLKK
nr:S-layer homology domain-containing protein [Lysinibacillus timonensis]